MIVGTVLCKECGIVVNVVDPNGGGRVCLDCCNLHGKQECCNKCDSNNTKEMLYLAGKLDEIGPQCTKGLLHFCI